MKTEIEREKIHAVCPHCSKNIDSAWVFKLDSVIGVRYVYLCERCQKSLGIFQKKVMNIPVTGALFPHNKIKHQIN